MHCIPTRNAKALRIRPSESQLWVDSVEKVGISGWKKATLALVSEPGHYVAWLSSSALTVAAWLIG